MQQQHTNPKAVNTTRYVETQASIGGQCPRSSAQKAERKCPELREEQTPQHRQEQLTSGQSEKPSQEWTLNFCYKPETLLACELRSRNTRRRFSTLKLSGSYLGLPSLLAEIGPPPPMSTKNLRANHSKRDPSTLKPTYNATPASVLSQQPTEPTCWGSC